MCGSTSGCRSDEESALVFGVMRGWTLWRVREGQSTDTPADGGAGNVHEDISQIF